MPVEKSAADQTLTLILVLKTADIAPVYARAGHCLIRDVPLDKSVAGRAPSRVTVSNVVVNVHHLVALEH